MNSLDPKAKQVASAVENLRRVIAHAKGEARDGFSLSRTQLEVLFVVCELPGSTTSKIAAKLFLTPGAVTQTVETLVKRNLITRTADTNDRRVSHHHLSREGAKLTAEFQKKRLHHINNFISNLSSDEIDVLLEVTHKLTSFIEISMQEEHKRKGDSQS